MATLRIKVELHKGKRGIPLHKLAEISQDFEKYLRMLGSDLGQAADVQDWLAVDFKNESVDFTLEFQRDVAPEFVGRYNQTYRDIAGGHIASGELPYAVRPETIKQYADIANHISSGESIDFGFYSNGDTEPTERASLTKKTASALTRIIDEKIEYFGEIQCRIHSAYFAATPMYFDARELATGVLTQCFIDDKHERGLYGELHRAIVERDAVFFVSGVITARKFGNRKEKISVKKITPAPKYREGDLNRFEGCAPKLTGSLSTSAYLRRIRNG